MTPLQNRVVVYLDTFPGVSGIQVADRFRVESKTYGRQRATSTAIAGLRRLKLVQDVKRCSRCHRALTRGHRNVPLYLTARGRRLAARLRYDN